MASSSSLLNFEKTLGSDICETGLYVPSANATALQTSASWAYSRKSSANGDTLGLLTTEVTSTQIIPPLPSNGPDFGVIPRTCVSPSNRAGEAVYVPPVKYASISPLISAVFIWTRSSVCNFEPANIWRATFSYAAISLSVCTLNGSTSAVTHMCMIFQLSYVKTP